MSDSYWVGPLRWRWLGARQWHRWAVGPLCVSFYVYRRAERQRPFVTTSWRYRNVDGEWRHATSFGRWRRGRRALNSGSRSDAPSGSSEP